MEVSPNDHNTDSRIAHVDPRVDLMEVFGGPAVEAAVVRQQIVQLLESHLEARHVEAHRSRRRLHLLAVFTLHARRSEAAPPPRHTQKVGGKEGGERGGQVSVYRAGAVRGASLSVRLQRGSAQPAARCAQDQTHTSRAGLDFLVARGRWFPIKGSPDD